MRNTALKRIKYLKDEMEAVHGTSDQLKVLNATAARFDFDEMGNSLRFILRNERMVRSMAGAWLAYDGKRWNTEEADNFISILAQNTIRDMTYEHQYIEDVEMADKFMKWKKKSSSYNQVQNMLKLAKAHLAVLPSTFDSQSTYFNAFNGVINLETGELEKHDPDFMMTKISPVKYNPNADSSEWEQVVLDICSGDQEKADFLRRAVGYSMFGEQSETAAFFITGDERNQRKNGSNGKSLFLNMIAKVFGEYACSIPTSLVVNTKIDKTGDQDRAALFGRRLAIGAEFGQSDVLNDADFKKLSGDDAINARQLYKDPIKFRSGATMWFGTNYVPFVAGNDDGVWRRMFIIPFTQKFYDRAEDAPEGGKVKDINLERRLSKNLEGILAWAVRGAVEYSKDGLNTPQFIREERQLRRKDFDPLDLFFETCIIEDDDASELAINLYNAFSKFAEMNAIGGLTPNMFGRKLEGRGHTKIEGMRNVHRRGLYLNYAGRQYLNGLAPDEGEVVEMVKKPFTYILGDTNRVKANSLEDLPNDVRDKVREHCKNGLPPIRLVIPTPYGNFCRTA